jgi:hypothetical protein
LRTNRESLLQICGNLGRRHLFLFW